MTASISSQVVSLGKLLHNGETFTVPPHQRNYAWEEDQYGVFWTDISRTFPADARARDYFLGSLVIRNSGGSELVVIDGQQRLITTAILVSALRSHLRADGFAELAARVERNFLAKTGKDGSASTPSLVLNRTNRAFYDTYIFLNHPAADILRQAGDDTLPASNLLIAECFTFMHRRIGELKDGGRRLDELAEAIVTSLNERVLVIRIDVRDEHDAFVLFETLNDRGLELSEADLLKNHLFAISGGRLDETQGNWEQMEQNLGPERLIKFVRHHWLSTRGMTGERGLFSDIKAAIATPAAAVAYSATLSEASECYAALSGVDNGLWAEFPDGERAEIRELIGTIETLRPEQLFIVLLAALEVDRRSFLDLTRMLVTFTFRYNTICNLTPSAILQPFIAAARDIRETGRADVPALFRKYLEKLYPEDSQFHSAFSRKIVRSNAQARYILRHINDHLAPDRSARTENDAEKTNLEHILPKRYGAAWEVWRRDFPGGIDKFVYRLGNMTLISTPRNSELGNADFGEKKRVYAEDCLNITRKVLEAEKWTAEEIANRQNWLASQACKIWRYPE